MCHNLPLQNKGNPTPEKRSAERERYSSSVRIPVRGYARKRRGCRISAEKNKLRFVNLRGLYLSCGNNTSSETRFATTSQNRVYNVEIFGCGNFTDYLKGRDIKILCKNKLLRFILRFISIDSFYFPDCETSFFLQIFTVDILRLRRAYRYTQKKSSLLIFYHYHCLSLFSTL